MGRRVLSLLLAIVMMIGMFPVNVFAEQDNDTGNIGQEIVESTTEPAVQSDENANGEKKMTADELAVLFRTLPAASSITASTTEEEKTAIMAALETVMNAFDNMSEENPEEAAVFAEKYADLYYEAAALNDALTGNEAELYATIAYDPNSSRNLTITVNNSVGELVTGATVTVTRNADTYTVRELGNGQYAFTKNSILNSSRYTVTVSAPGHESKSITVRGNQSATTITLNKLEDLNQENWVDFKVFYIATGKIPDRYAGAGDAADYGPSSNNTPLVIIKVDINKLRREYSDVALYQQNTDGNQYHFIPVGAAKDEAAAQRFWTAVKDCMHPDSVAAFAATGLYNDYCVYVLKKQGDGSQHADGILSKIPPVYVIELYSTGTYFGGFVTDKNGNFVTMDQVRAKFEEHYQARLGVQIHWDATGKSGYYLTEDNAYTVTLTQTNEGNANHKPTGSEIKYQSRNNTNTYYLATFNLDVTEGAEGFHTVRYTDGVAHDDLFADQVSVLTTGSKVPAFTGDPQGKRPGYHFAGWILEGGDGKILSDAEVTAMTVDRNLVFHAEWSRIPTEFTATITVLLNDTYPSDIVDMLGNSNAALYVKADGGNYIPLTRSELGVYTAELPNGIYKTYCSVDGGSTFTPIDDRVFAIASAEGGRKVKFNSVSYDLAGGTSVPEIPQLNFYHAGTAVHVNNALPTRDGYVFMGWNSSEGVTYQPGEQITDYIVTPYRLTAQWKKAIDVTVTVVIEHSVDDTAFNDDVTFSLVELQQGTTVHTGKSVTLTKESHSGYEIAENADTKTITYSPTAATFRDLPEADYTANCFKASYEVKTTKIVDTDGNQHITLTLKYTPEDFALNFVVQMDESAMDDKNLWPQAVRVKAVRWEKSGETTSGWEVVPQHQSTSALVTIDPETGLGSGYVNVPKHWPGLPDEMADYRIVVTAFIMPDGTTVTAQPVPGFVCPSSNGIYEAVITTEQGGRTPTYPTATTDLAAYYKKETNAQDGIPTAIISINSFDVIFKADTVKLDEDSFGMVEGKASHTVSKQIKIPRFEDFDMTAPDEGYLFEGWYSMDGTVTGDWGKKIVAGTDITGSITVYAKWKAPITIAGDVYVSTTFNGENGEQSVIFEHDRIRTVTIVLRHQGLGGHIDTQNVTITYTDDLGHGTYEFTNIPDDGNIYFIEERSANYTGRYQNEPDSLTDPLAFKDYTGTGNTALLDGDLVATVNAYLDFEPASFDLKYQVDATAISSDFRPEQAEILVTYEGDSTSPDPSQWPVIVQMVSGTDENGREAYEGDQVLLTDGRGGSSTSVWNGYPDGATLYEYGIRLNGVQGLGRHTGTDAPYSVDYEDPAYYVTGSQSKMLKAILTPNQYAVIYDLGIDETAVTGMENAPKRHTWSFTTEIDVAPQRMGYEFLGWYDNDQFTGNPVTEIDASVSADTVLYAKWLQVQDKVDMTVTIIHTTADSGRASNYDKDLKVQLIRTPKDKTNAPYEDVSGQTRTYTGFYWHTLDDDTTEDVFGVNEIFSKLSSAYAYSLNVSLEGYYVTEKKVTPIVDPDSGATTYDVDITLQYNPDLLRMTVNARMAEGIAKDLWPVSAAVKINCWYAITDDDIPIGWNTITQHDNTSLTITLDENGRGSVSYPVWQWESEARDKPYYYRMEVVSLRLSDGTVVMLNSSDDVVYSGGNYMATIETDADCVVPDGNTELAGAYGTENSSGNGYVQTGTVTAVISTDIWDDDTADHMQAAIVFKSADETMGSVEGKLLQIFDLEADAGDYRKTVKPETVETKAVPGYEFSHWVNENGAVVTDPFVDQELTGGRTYTYTAHWKARTNLSYTVNYLDDLGNSIQTAKTVTGMTFGNTVYSSGEIVEITGYVFEKADVDSIRIGVGSNVINLYYTKDSNGDQIPDEQQVFVNFRSGDNGSVRGETEQVFTLAENNGQYTGRITPEKVTATADTGYTFLKWTKNEDETSVDPFLPMEVEGGQTYTFTANWTIRQDYGYTVRYLEKESGKALADLKPVTNRQYNSTVTEEAIAITGYTLDGADKQTITLDTDGKVITFYYNILDNLSLTVHHLEWGTEKKLHDETFVHNLRFESQPNLDVLIVDIHGYQHHSTAPEKITISADNKENTVIIYYERAVFPYRYEHYYNDVLDETRTTESTALYGTVIDSYTESHKDGFALDAIVGLPLTVGGHEATNVIKLYYTKDVYGEDGEESDGIPDKYQAIVRYRIVDGTWNVNGSGSGDIVQYYTLYTGNAADGWTLKDPAPTLKDIPGGTGNAGYQANGQWDHRFDDKTAVTKDVTYTLSFDHIHYTISAQVFNGTAEVDGETFVSPYEYHYDDKETTTIVFAPFAGYVLEKVEVDGHDAVLTDNSYTFKHNDGNHSITVVYAEDTNNNGTPDKYEATVTFYVVNGTWADGSADPIEEHFLLRTWNEESGKWEENAKTLKGKIPTGMLVAETYNPASGKWLQSITDETPVTQNAFYTYAFTDKEYFLLDVTVINGTAAGGGETGDNLDFKVEHDKSASTELTFTPAENYVLDKVTLNGSEIPMEDNRYTLPHDGNYSMVVIYAEDLNDNGIPDKYEVTVTFYIVNGTWKDGKKDPVQVPFQLRKWEDGKWVDNNPTLNGYIPVDMEADYSYDSSTGRWLQDIDSNTPVNRAAVYTYAYTKSQFLLDVTVVNGTAAGGGETGEIIDIEVDHNDDQFTTFTFTPAENYTLDVVTVDGNPVGMVGNTYNLYHNDNHSMVVIYAEDNNHNGIPDKYEVTVTYYVVNGTWEDGTTAGISVPFCLKEWNNDRLVETNPTLGNTIPTGMEAAEGFDETSGVWLQEIDENTAVTRDAVYTFAFTNLNSYLLDVTVVNGTAAGGGKSGANIAVEVKHNPDASTTFTFTPAKDHVLDRVTVDGQTVKMEGNTYTLKHDSSHSIVVVYAENKNGNTTPDKYDATVTYNVVNGTWADKTADAISHVFALYAMDDSGVWQPLNPTLGNTVPTGMIAAAGHHGGEWNTGIGSTTPVIRNASYTFSFSLDYYLINAVVINGSARVGDEPFEAVTVPYSATGKTKIDFAPNDDENHHYIVESVTVDEKVLNLSAEELKNFSSYEFDHLNNHHIRVAYALDNNRDNIPDKYQKKVTFRIIHGTWDDDRTVEKSIYVNLLKDGVFDTAGSAVVTEPEYKKIPAAGFVGGEWDVTFPQTVTGTDEIVYTYTFNQKQQIQIIIEVLGGTSHPVHSDTVYDYDETDHEIAFKANEGYVFDSAKVKEGDLEQAQWKDIEAFNGKITHDHSVNQHIRVVYKPDTNGDDIADDKQVFVQFVSEDTQKGTVTGENTEQVLDYAESITPNADKIDVNALDGYAFSHWTDNSGKTVDPFTGFRAEGGKTYVFTAHWTQLDIGYTIRYVDEDGKEIRAPKTGTMHYGDRIVAETEIVDITDYVFIRADKDVLEIALETEQNLLTLTYGKDLWKDTPTGEDSETGGDDVPDSKQALIRFVSSDVTQGTVTGSGTVQVFTLVDESKVVTPSSVTVTPAAGYILSHWVSRETGEKRNDPFVPVLVTGGMVKEYAAHWAKRTDLSYTVNHLDLSGKAIAQAQTVTDVTFETVIYSAPYVKEISGYIFDHADADSIVIGVGSNIINLYYAQDVNEDEIADYKQFFVHFTADQGGKVEGQTTQVFTLPEVNGKYTGTVTPVRAGSAADTTGVLVVADARFAEDYWSRDGEVNTPVNPFTEMNAEGGRSVTFTVHFAADDNQDTVPDKYQAMVTYRIVGGFWKGQDNLDIVEYITLFRQDENLVWVPVTPAPTLGDTVPDVTKAHADASLGLTEPGHWGEKDDLSDDPASTTVAKDKAVYTYTFADRIPYNITVTVENGSFTVGGESVSSPIVVRYDDDLKLDFAAMVEEGKNYVIESVTVDGTASELEEDGSISFEDIREDHNVHVVYGPDMWADPEQDKDPDKPGDGISDNFQIKVNYHAIPPEFGRVSLEGEIHTLLDADGKPVKQGDLELTGSEAIPNSMDETGKYLFVNWTDTVTAPAPGEVAGAVGTEEILKLKLENVIGGSEYDYYANFRYEMKIASVYFVEHYLWNAEQSAYVLDEEATFLGRGYVGDQVQAQVRTYAGYTVNPNTSILQGIITEPMADPDSQLPANVLTLKVCYDVDQVGEEGETPDNIPDIYQKKVTFKVVNGTFRNGAAGRSTETAALTERVVYLTLRDEQGNFSETGKAKLTAPTDMQPDAGYQGGKWDQTPPEEVSGTEPVTYTYRYVRIPTNTPKTGDDSHIGVWLCMMTVSLDGMIDILFRESRKKRRTR